MTTTETVTADGASADRAAQLMINWDIAKQTAARLAPPGPRLSPAEAAAEVAALRAAAEESVTHVHQITGLAAAERLGEDLSDVLVVDRPGWSAANAESFRQLLAPGLQAAVSKKPQLAKEGSDAQVLGSAAAGAELGGILGFLSANVLGQFEPFDQGRLMLVAPNVVSVATRLHVDRDDFRLWVCLHEQTHRVQFAAAPWLAEHLKAKITELSVNTMGQADTLPQRLAEVAKQLRAERRTRKASDRSSPENAGDDADSAPRQRLLSALQSPEDRATMSHLTAVMSLLEGHANVVMDAVDSSIVPSVKTIRRRFDDRGRHRSPLQKLIRRLLQLDAKAAQYRDGQKFTGHIVERIGMDRFNIIWDAPEHLPSEDEIHHPEAWLDRMGFTTRGPAAEPTGTDG